jgi:hypothetical protein
MRRFYRHMAIISNTHHQTWEEPLEDKENYQQTPYRADDALSLPHGKALHVHQSFL